jgi:hypothetical protein
MNEAFGLRGRARHLASPHSEAFSLEYLSKCGVVVVVVVVLVVVVVVVVRVVRKLYFIYM